MLAGSGQLTIQTPRSSLQVLKGALAGGDQSAAPVPDQSSFCLESFARKSIFGQLDTSFSDFEGAISSLGSTN
jgi:hypothetical protein